MIRDVLLGCAPLILWGVLALAWWWWGRARRRAGIPRRRRWPSLILVGPPQPRGQAALADETVEVGQDHQVDGLQYRVDEVEDIPGGMRRAWLVDVSEDVRRKLDLAARRKLVDQLEVQLEDVVQKALEPFWGQPWEMTPDVVDILNHAVRRALCAHADRLHLIQYGVRSSAELPPRALWPTVEPLISQGVDNGRISWSCRVMAEHLARRWR